MLLAAVVCGPLVRGSLLGLHGNTAREEKYIIRDAHPSLPPSLARRSELNIPLSLSLSLSLSCF